MTDSLRIPCPNCGVVQRVPRDKLPEQGTWAKCSTCRESVFIKPPDGSTSVGTPAEAQIPGSVSTPSPGRDNREGDPDGHLFLKTPEGKTIQGTHQEIEGRIRMERVLPWDLISSDGERFEPIQKHPDFLDSFQGFALNLQKNCWNHTETVALMICVRCRRCYCAECMPDPANEEQSTRTCRACGGVLQDTDPGWRLRPYWLRLKEVIQFPNGRHALLATGGLALVLWLASLSAATLPLYLVVLLFLMYVLYASAKGGKSLHEALRSRRGSAEIWDILERGLLAGAIMVVFAAPLVLVHIYIPFSVAAIFIFFMGLTAFGYHLMAIAVAMLSEKPLAAFQPRVVVKQIQAMGEDYLSLLLGLLLILISFGVNHFVIGRIPILGIPLTKIIVAYGLIVSAHMIGWTYYLNLGRLGWRRTSFI
jgi:hypothetical protein